MGTLTSQPPPSAGRPSARIGSPYPGGPTLLQIRPGRKPPYSAHQTDPASRDERLSGPGVVPPIHRGQRWEIISGEGTAGASVLTNPPSGTAAASRAIAASRYRSGLGKGLRSTILSTKGGPQWRHRQSE
jgi:hypothetical protein